MLFVYSTNTIWLKSDLSLLSVLIYRVVEDSVETTCEWSYVPCNENGDFKTMKVLLNCFAYYEQFDWPNNVITRFIILLYIHDIRLFAWYPWQFPQISQRHISKGEQVGDVILIRLWDEWSKNLLVYVYCTEEFEDAKGIIRIHKS